MKFRWQGIYGLDGDARKNLTQSNNDDLYLQSVGVGIEHGRSAAQARAEAQPTQPNQTLLKDAEERVGRAAAQPLAKKQKRE